MRKPLLIALFLGLVAFKAEAQVDYVTVRSVTISSKAPPKDWFGTWQERESAAALLRISLQIDSEKDVKRREFGSTQIALGLARLGREKEARQMVKSATVQRQINYLTAIRAILNGREDTAISLLSSLDELQKVNIQTLLGNAFYAWRHDKVNARKWLLEARSSLLRASRLTQNGSFMEIEIALNLAKVGATDDARTIFKALEQKWQNPKMQQGEGAIYLASLFTGRLQSGFEQDAYDMLERNKALLPMVIQTLFTSKKEAKALEFLKEESPLQAFEILRDFNRFAREKENKSQMVFEAMKSYWKQLSIVQRNDTSNASDMALAIARYESMPEAFNFIASNLSGAAANEAIRSLKAEVYEDVDLQKQMNPKTLQSWREEELKNEELRARKSASEPRGFNGSTNEEASWTLVYYAAFQAKNLKKARFALDKSEQIAMRGDNANPAESMLTRYNAWLQLGDTKRANWNLLQFKREIAKFKGHPDAVYGFGGIFLPPELIKELLRTQPPRDLNIVARLLSFSLLDEQNSASIPAWYLKIPDAPTRAVLIANRASSLWPIETVRIQLN